MRTIPYLLQSGPPFLKNYRATLFRSAGATRYSAFCAASAFTSAVLPDFPSDCVPFPAALKSITENEAQNPWRRSPPLPFTTPILHPRAEPLMLLQTKTPSSQGPSFFPYLKETRSSPAEVQSDGDRSREYSYRSPPNASIYPGF